MFEAVRVVSDRDGVAGAAGRVVAPQPTRALSCRSGAAASAARPPRELAARRGKERRRGRLRAAHGNTRRRKRRATAIICQTSTRPRTHFVSGSLSMETTQGRSRSSRSARRGIPPGSAKTGPRSSGSPTGPTCTRRAWLAGLAVRTTLCCWRGAMGCCGRRSPR